MLALIDGDLLVYRVAYTTINDEEWIARARLREMIGGILRAVNTEEYKIFLSDSKGNFRLQYFPNYKANRPKEKPQHLAYLQNLIVDEWGAEVAWGQEADDALGIAQNQSVVGAYSWDTVICSIDKDLLMIPGNHYNFVKEEMKFITPEEGIYRFYKQLLTGDSGDNITVAQGLSCPGIGAIKAERLLEGYNNEQDYFQAVREAYKKGWNSKVDSDEILLKTGILLKIRTQEGEIWSFPKQSPSEGVQLESSSGMQEQERSPL